MIWEYTDKWKGKVSVNGIMYNSVRDASKVPLTDDCEIVLYPETTRQVEIPKTVQEYKITVKQYMTRPASVDFDFMQQWNDNNPMPLRTMVGTIEKETRGMVYMNLHGDITARRTQYCMKCGKTITNPVSQFFGMGPECGGHNYVNPFESDSELQEVVSQYRREYLQKITWSGWIIKSAIIEQEEL